jgi:DNA-binding CsgD family transcriptional regulator
MSLPFLHLHFASSPLDSVSDDRTCQRETNIFAFGCVSPDFCRKVALLRASDSTLASLRTDLSFGHVKAKHRHIVSFASRPADFASGHDWTNALPQACFHSGQIGALTPRQADFIFGHIRTNAAPQACFCSGQIGALTARQADFIFGHIGTDAAPQACFYSGQIGALTPRQADFIFGHIGTDAAPQACFYSGQIGALTPRQADFIFGYDDK